MATLAAAVVAACGCASPEAPGPPFQVFVVDLVSVDPVTGAGQFELAPRELTTVSDLDRLDGPYLRMLRGGELVEQAGQVTLRGGRDPGLRYSVEGGVVVPLDYPSLVMVSAYYQFERLFEQLPNVTGLTIDELIAGGDKLTVYFEPAGDEIGVSNAFYAGQRRWVLSRRSDTERVPLAIDPRVLAHELGHVLFERGFFDGAPVACDRAAAHSDPLFPGRLELEYGVIGFDEGIADFVSFAATGGTSPLFDTGFPPADRDFHSTFTYESLALGTGCTSGLYCVGTLVARSLFQAMPALAMDPASPDARGALSRTVLAALAGARGRIDATHLPAPGSPVTECDTRHDLDASHDGRVIGSVLEAWLAGLDPVIRAAVCDQLIASFGELGFPAEARTACP
ncbi:MAG: hypothetical protein AB7O24_02255 [Kofleriaceae bacterium]